MNQKIHKNKGGIFMNKQIRGFLRDSLGFKDDDVDKLSPHMIRLLTKMSDIMSYRVIAEVIESAHCPRNLKVGDKYVLIGADLDLKESTAPFCIYLMPPIARVRLIITERIVEGLDPNGLLFNTIECEDPGLDYGGLGHVRMRVNCERTA